MACDVTALLIYVTLHHQCYLMLSHLIIEKTAKKRKTGAKQWKKEGLGAA